MFDGAGLFMRVAFFMLAAALIGFELTGWAGLISTGIALYFLLGFFNALEGRGIADGGRTTSRRNSRRRY